MASAIENEKITLTYFQEISARGQFVTAILDIIGRKYELKSIPHGKWETEKLNTPFGVLPVLDVDGKKIGGTVTIARFVAERYGKGKLDQESDPFISAYYEGQADISNEILVKLYTYSFAKEEEKEDKRKAFESYAKDKLSFLEKSIKPGGSFQGKEGKLTWSEIVISSLLRDIRSVYPNHEEVLKEFPNLRAMCENICRLLPKK
ncbi:hypothetical protein LOD99_1716 [Oopsacas minuta]|uniref:GST N-terminal domain-containing protein n=1 Tax=Oopsacas minuta TaxID=111878 RepID=A0AAV7K482_9METZ|nr:hypothetical protein LOD99_1705 [Oopsacas minuta]KAI6655982.1 hypothetical protein LOD99_1716 [Oopsacas minuta]